MSRFWVRTAGMVLLTMNADRRHDVTLLARVAGLRAQDGDCPNAGLTAEHQPLPLARRNWYTIQDPNTGMQPLPGWTLCATCVLALQTCCPALAPAFAPVQPLGERDSSCGLVPSDRYDDTRTGMVLQQVGACAVITAVTRRPDMSQLLNWLRANPPPVRTGVAPAPGGVAGPGVVPVSGVAGGNCPRNMLSTTHKCYTMQGLFDFTVCEDCYGAVVKLDLDKGVELARRFDGTPSAMASGFTCQLYSDRMRRVWADAVSTGDFEYLRQKVLERRAKEREVQTKTAQLQQQAAQLRQQAEVKEHLAANAMRVAANAASNNILLAGVGVTYQVDAYHYVRPSGVADFSQTTQLNNEAAMLKVQAAQAESEMAMAGDEWRRYWE
ncbi:hypothetical protein QBC47DRAFT_386216 [Echria macrotheca]|uniref:Uncharacterized protein n=1 Tax=Echria macrotheca TaxID=438768 RepID=A0AAJ0BAD8_9PEZI|nr:hypothetical protein QBC47DRAFT_386216 [Echria macrotheca]